MAASSTPRRGARSRDALELSVKRDLEAGRLETKTLSEALAIDFTVLARAVKIDPRPLAADGVVARMKEMGSRLDDWRSWVSHPSDTVRGWAAYRLASDDSLTFRQRLEAMRPFAADHHFGVREWAWLALREDLAAHLDEALKVLAGWALDENHFIRRFASEATRPRGVWCAHLDALKTRPQLALPILEPLKSDAEGYVRDSVANWLNDAGKSQPQWVEHLLASWAKSSPTAETAAIIKRASRNLNTTKAKKSR